MNNQDIARLVAIKNHVEAMLESTSDTFHYARTSKIPGNLFGQGDWNIHQQPPYTAIIGMIVDDWDEKHFGHYPYAIFTAKQLDNMAYWKQTIHKGRKNLYAEFEVTTPNGTQAVVAAHNIGGRAWLDLTTDSIIINHLMAKMLGLSVGDIVSITPMGFA